MRNASKLKIHWKKCGIGLFAVAILFFGIGNAIGQGISIFKANKAEIDRYFKYKYGFETVVSDKGLLLRGIRRVSSRNDLHLCGTVYGLSIKDSIGGKGGIRPPHLKPDVKDYQTIIQAFFKEEAELFGLTSMSEMRSGRKGAKKRIEKGPGKYEAVEGRGRGGLYHYIGEIPLECTDTLINLNPDGTIKSLGTNIVPVTPELLRALNQPTLSEDDIRRIVEEDLQNAAQLPDTPGIAKDAIKEIYRGELPNAHPKTMEIEKAAIPVPPYVVYKAFSAWDYTIDAFTGKILQKLPTWWF